MPLKARPEGLQPLQQVRIARRITQAELAEAIGERQPLISMLETGVQIPTRVQLARICKKLEAKPEALFTAPVLDELERRMKVVRR